MVDTFTDSLEQPHFSHSCLHWFGSLFLIQIKSRLIHLKGRPDSTYQPVRHDICNRTSPRTWEIQTDTVFFCHPGFEKHYFFFLDFLQSVAWQCALCKGQKKEATNRGKNVLASTSWNRRRRRKGLSRRTWRHFHNLHHKKHTSSHCDFLFRNSARGAASGAVFRPSFFMWK